MTLISVAFLSQPWWVTVMWLLGLRLVIHLPTNSNLLCNSAPTLGFDLWLMVHLKMNTCLDSSISEWWQC